MPSSVSANVRRGDPLSPTAAAASHGSGGGGGIHQTVQVVLVEEGPSLHVEHQAAVLEENSCLITTFHRRMYDITGIIIGALRINP